MILFVKATLYNADGEEAGSYSREKIVRVAPGDIRDLLPDVMRSFSLAADVAAEKGYGMPGWTELNLSVNVDESVPEQVVMTAEEVSNEVARRANSGAVCAPC